MKILNLSAGSSIYTANVYLLTGEWNTLDDVNTLIDAGRDEAIIEKLEAASTGVGKRKLDQIILTHDHYDHAALIPRLKELYSPRVYAASANTDGVDHLLKPSTQLRAADQLCEIIFTPGHSSDSICIYCPQQGILFAGDTPLIIHSSHNTYEPAFIEALKYISRKPVKAIYFGHDKPLLSRCQEILEESYRNVREQRQQV